MVQMPNLAGHMEEEGVLSTMYCSQWFLTLYAYTLPIDHLLRVWDVFMLEGPKVLFRFVYRVTSIMCLADHFLFCCQCVGTQFVVQHDNSRASELPQRVSELEPPY